MQTPHATVKVSYWSQAGKDRSDPRLNEPGSVPLALGPDGRFHRGTLQVPADGLLRIRYSAPRPLRIWIGGVMAVDESLDWRQFIRRMHGAVLLPVTACNLCKDEIRKLRRLDEDQADIAQALPGNLISLAWVQACSTQSHPKGILPDREIEAYQEIVSDYK